MSSFARNLKNVVNAQILSKPNNLLLRSYHNQKYLCFSNEATINHLQTSKALT
jgi:hypothetical protein